MSLINEDVIKNHLTFEEAFHTSHHATDTFLGGGMLYYAFAYLLKSKCSVCLGSGSGFVPRIMRQAQRDLNLTESETILVDADMPEAGWGAPDYHNKETYFSKNFDVKIIKKTTRDALPEFVGKEIEYLHIDADHSYEWVKHDFFSYRQFLKKHAIVTFHDSMVPVGVKTFIEELKKDSRFEVCNVQIGTGVAIVKEHYA